MTIANIKLVFSAKKRPIAYEICWLMVYLVCYISAALMPKDKFDRVLDWAARFIVSNGYVVRVGAKWTVFNG